MMFYPQLEPCSKMVNFVSIMYFPSPPLSPPPDPPPAISTSNSEKSRVSSRVRLDPIPSLVLSPLCRHNFENNGGAKSQALYRIIVQKYIYKILHCVLPVSIDARNKRFKTRLPLSIPLFI